MKLIEKFKKNDSNKEEVNMNEMTNEGKSKKVVKIAGFVVGGTAIVAATVMAVLKAIGSNDSQVDEDYEEDFEDFDDEM